MDELTVDEFGMKISSHIFKPLRGWNSSVLIYKTSIPQWDEFSFHQRMKCRGCF
jgi:hypothetical protein